jgi:hypothetical protein
MSTCAHGAQINVGDLTPYLTYVPDANILERKKKMFLGLLDPDPDPSIIKQK